MGEMVDLKTTEAYLAKPEGTVFWPAIIVIHEWWGLNDNIKDLTNRFAKEGFLAIAPDLYQGYVATTPQDAQKRVDQLSLEDGLKLCLEAVDYLKSRNDVGKIGVTGFCMGGKYALLLASNLAEISVAAPFYGHVPKPPEQLVNIKCPVLGHYGAEDDGIPPEEVELLKDMLTKSGTQYEIIVYEGAGHAFMNDTRDSYRPEVAKKAWEKTIKFFKKNLY